MLRKKKFSQASKPTPLASSIPYDKLLIKLFSNHSSKALSHKQICTLLKVKEGAQRKLVFDKLIELTRKGVVKRIGHSEFSLTKNENLVYGSLSIVNSGVGFVSI